MKKLTKEIFQEKSNIIHNSEYEIIGEYINNRTPIKIKHLVCGNINLQQPNNHLSGKGCNLCFNPKITKEILQERSNKKYNNEYLIIGEYINYSTSIEIKHLVCDNISKSTPDNHLHKNGKGGCNICFRTIKSNKEELQEKSDKIHNSEYLIIGEYINCDSNIEIKHLICNHIFYQKPYSHLYNNKCPKCHGKNRLTKEILQEKSDIKYGKDEYTILGEYNNNHTPILIKHNKCGSEYMQTPNNHLRDRECYRCRKNSIGENKIMEYLENRNINYIFNKSLKDCSIKNKKLRFDFYLPEYNICIEYDGEQHFKPIKVFGGDKHYQLTLERDNIKNQWCLDNNIKLYRISYRDDLFNILNNLFL